MMKKVLLIILAVCMVFAAVACAPRVATIPTASVAQETESASTKELDETNASEDANNSKLEALAKEAEDELKSSELSKELLKVMDISIVAEDNVLIYRYTYKDIDSSGDISLIKKALEEQYETLDAQMKPVLGLVQAAADGASLRVEYLTSDGEIISSRDYK